MTSAWKDIVIVDEKGEETPKCKLFGLQIDYRYGLQQHSLVSPPTVAAIHYQSILADYIEYSPSFSGTLVRTRSDEWGKELFG